MGKPLLEPDTDDAGLPQHALIWGQLTASIGMSTDQSRYYWSDHYSVQKTSVHSFRLRRGYLTKWHRKRQGSHKRLKHTSLACK